MANLNPASAEKRRSRTVGGAPVAGTDEVQTLTFGGTITGGGYRVAYKGQKTPLLTWTTVDETLRDELDAALGALSTIGGAGNVAVAIGTASDGIGTLTITFGGNLAKLAVPLITVDINSLTGTSPTVAVTETTPGVTATHRGAPVGALLSRTDSGVWYQNTGTIYAPTWTAVSVANVSAEMVSLAAAIPTAAVATVAGAGITIAAANGVAVAGATPAGGTGATAGAYDTAVNRDAFIATVAEMKVTVNALVTEATELKLDIGTLSTTVVEIKTSLNALLAELRTALIVTP